MDSDDGTTGGFSLTDNNPDNKLATINDIVHTIPDIIPSNFGMDILHQKTEKKLTF